jgi:hypothetical protein
MFVFDGREIELTVRYDDTPASMLKNSYLKLEFKGMLHEVKELEKVIAGVIEKLK